MNLQVLYVKHRDQIHSFIDTFITIMAVDYGAYVLTIYNGDFSTAAFSALGGGVLRELLKTFGKKV